MRRHLIRRALRKFINWILKDDNKKKQDTGINNTINEQGEKNIIVGQFVSIDKNVIFCGNESMKIGNHTMIGSGTIILSSLYNLKYTPHGRKCIDKPVNIGNEVVIGAGSIIYPGINIGNFSIIKPGSVVSIDIPDGAIVEGNPAKIMSIRDDLSKLKSLDQNLLAIKIIDTAFAHVEYTTGKNKCPYFKWDRSPLDGNEKVVFYTDNCIPQVNPNLKKKVAWLLEPQEIKPQLYDWVKNNREKFDVVLTHDKSLLDLKDNFEFIPYGGCWITREEQKIYNKSKLISIIASGKKETKGHKLRHGVIKDINKKFPNLLDVYGRGYYEIESKLFGLSDYMFHIVIENNEKDYYFTEKLIDCFATGTVPLYWGCPSIGEFFDKKGIIAFQTKKQLYKIVKNLSQNLYEDMLQAIKNNFEEAKKYALVEDWLYMNKKKIFE